MARSKEKKIIPRPAVRRLTRYLPHLQRLRNEGVKWVSSQMLAATLGLTSSTVRQDLTHLKFSGFSKKGYETEELIRVLEETLGVNQIYRAAVAGAGNLGRALAGHRQFVEGGFHIRCIYDKNPEVVGRKVEGLTVRSIKAMRGDVKRRNIVLGILAVPPAAAQEAADAFAGAGVKGILNLASTHVKTPPDVAVVHARLMSNLQELVYLMKEKELAADAR